MNQQGRPVTFLSLGVPHDAGMVKAAELLMGAENCLLYARGDLGGHRDEAIRHINSAVDEIRAFEETGNHQRYGVVQEGPGRGS